MAEMFKNLLGNKGGGASLCPEGNGNCLKTGAMHLACFSNFAEVTQLGILLCGIPCNACPKRKGSFRKKPRKWLEQSSS